MFGKGVYFADMVSKSANYCATSRSNPTGILLLCEVALGETNDLYHSDYNASDLPAGKSSTRGLGRTIPNPNHSAKLGDVHVPFGKPEKDGKDQNELNRRSLMYNEFIVYDISQIKIKYLIKTRFNY